MQSPFNHLCDDIVEDILQWLQPLDMIRASAVNHQFNRCLKNVRQRTKFVDYSWAMQEEELNRKLRHKYVFPRSIPFRIHSFHRFISKFPNIRTLKLGFNEKSVDFNHFLRILLEFKRLRRIKGMDIFNIPFRQHLNEDLIAETIAAFIETFSKQWLKMSYYWPNIFKTRLLIASNLEVIHVSMRTFDFSLVSKLNFNKLREITIDDIDDLKFFELLKISPNIEKIILTFTEFKKGMTNVLRKILDFQRLKYLRIWCYHYGKTHEIGSDLNLQKKALSKEIEFICLNDYLLEPQVSENFNIC